MVPASTAASHAARLQGVPARGTKSSAKCAGRQVAASIPEFGGMHAANAATRRNSAGCYPTCQPAFAGSSQDAEVCQQLGRS